MAKAIAEPLDADELPRTETENNGAFGKSAVFCGLRQSAHVVRGSSSASWPIHRQKERSRESLRPRRHNGGRLRNAVLATVAIISLAAPAAAQQRPGLMGELMKDVNDVQGKLVGLAKATPADKYDWRPGAGVRSVGEVFLHLASDNYLLPSIAGFEPDAASGIKPTDLATLTTFEKQKLSPDATGAAMQRSFAHLLKSMADTPDSRLDERVKFFGQDMSVRQLWVLTTVHLHEHLGQSIAYARTNGITPPWSQKSQ